jgi:regulatory protein YycI of two-component signal transduction system YycFG
VGSAISMASWPKNGWGFLSPFIEWLKRPFNRTESKWDTFNSNAESTPKLDTKPNPKPLRYEKPFPPQTYTHEEREADLKMKNEAQALLKVYQARWKSANTDEKKKKLLNEFFAELQIINGTSATAEIHFNNSGKIAAYDTSNHTIMIDMSTIKGERLLISVMHEARHVYQAEAVRKGSTHPVSESRKQDWKLAWDARNWGILCGDALWYAEGL